MLSTHQYLLPHGEPYAPDARARIQRAAEFLGFDEVNARASEWTSYGDPTALHKINSFAEMIEGEVEFRRRQHRVAQDAAAAAEDQRIRRRNAAAAALLLD